ncbi:hypothetical protein [Streptomyces sp. cmx-18-6]
MPATTHAHTKPCITARDQDVCSAHRSTKASPAQPTSSTHATL